jgi:hypothetical protein
MKNNLPNFADGLRPTRRPSDAIAVLNRVLRLQQRSVANYLRFARPWTSESDHVLLAVVLKIADVQRANARRLGQLLVERRASPLRETFGEELTGLNFLSIRYAAAQVARDLNAIIAELQTCLPTFQDDREAARLIREVLADEQRNLATLQDELDHLENEARGIAHESVEAQRWVREHKLHRAEWQTSPPPLAV